ncbi:MAG TPA: hypothetical protein VF815_25440 [Myxococcaceae bacterium]|jgi:hypothetical protein
MGNSCFLAARCCVGWERCWRSHLPWASDNVLRQSGLSGYTFQTQKMADGALLAWKAIVIQA